jgi:hypothetical protein
MIQGKPTGEVKINSSPFSPLEVVPLPILVRAMGSLLMRTGGGRGAEVGAAISDNFFDVRRIHLSFFRTTVF